MPSKSTVSLQMIVKDEYDKVSLIILEALKGYFDEVNITVSDKKTFKKLTRKDEWGDFWMSGLHIEYRPWNDNFADARNDNMKLCDTTYLFWLDADDRFDFSTIPGLVEKADKEGLEAIYLPYEYARDDSGRVIALHWRERLVKLSAGFKWRGALHETLIIDRQFKATRLQAPAVVHESNDVIGSVERNHKILLKEAQRVPVDPRILHYLGTSYFAIGDYENCIKTLEEYIKVSGWDEEIYRSWLKMSEAASLMDNDDAARAYALEAIGTLPMYPNAYYSLAQLEFAQEQWKEALHYINVAARLKQPVTMSVVDPTMVERGKVIGACAEFQLGNYRDAVEILKQTDDPAVEKLLPNFEFEASKQRFTEIAPALTKHLDEKKFYDALAEDLKYDPRMRWLRHATHEPKVWPKKSIVWFVGQGYEEWGPHTMDKGMGGSEEAVINLSRQFAKLGYKVTIYGAVNEPRFDETDRPHHLVEYLPWRMFDTRDEFDTLIVWRAPHGIDKLKARVKILDVHDKLEAKDIPLYPGVQYHFKSRWHRELYPHIPDSQARVIGNGICKEQFK